MKNSTVYFYFSLLLASLPVLFLYAIHSSIVRNGFDTLALIVFLAILAIVNALAYGLYRKTQHSKAFVLVPAFSVVAALGLGYILLPQTRFSYKKEAYLEALSQEQDELKLPASPYCMASLWDDFATQPDLLPQLEADTAFQDLLMTFCDWSRIDGASVASCLSFHDKKELLSSALTLLLVQGGNPQIHLKTERGQDLLLWVAAFVAQGPNEYLQEKIDYVLSLRPEYKAGSPLLTTQNIQDLQTAFLARPVENWHYGQLQTWLFIQGRITLDSSRNEQMLALWTAQNPAFAQVSQEIWAYRQRFLAAQRSYFDEKGQLAVYFEEKQSRKYWPFLLHVWGLSYREAKDGLPLRIMEREEVLGKQFVENYYYRTIEETKNTTQIRSDYKGRPRTYNRKEVVRRQVKVSTGEGQFADIKASFWRFSEGKEKGLELPWRLDMRVEDPRRGSETWYFGLSYDFFNLVQ